jgi:hypothetical protein
VLASSTAALGPEGTAPGGPDSETPVTGLVLDDTSGAPIRDASVWVDGVEAVTDRDGHFSLGPPWRATRLVVKAPGYARVAMPAERTPLVIRLQRLVVKGAYLSYFGVGDARIRGRLFALFERTELNAVVIDVKGDRGMIPYRTSVPLAVEAGAQGPVMLKDMDGLLADLHRRGVYVVARIVAFKDPVLARHRPDLAVLDAGTGHLWLDHEQLAWIDPFREEVWEYLSAIAGEAAAKGFDEIHFDYLRFPSEGRVAAARYARPNTQATRLAAVTSVLARIRREIAPTPAFLSAALFGYTAFNEDDTGVGQRIEELAPSLDILCPMVYPSGYHLGIPGFRNPVEHPYEVVLESVRRTRRRANHTRAVVRPWIQDFRDYAFDHRLFGVAEVRAQIRAAEEAGAVGWTLWNPRNEYTDEALSLHANERVRPGPTSGDRGP